MLSDGTTCGRTDTFAGPADRRTGRGETRRLRWWKLARRVLCAERLTHLIVLRAHQLPARPDGSERALPAISEVAPAAAGP